jgi:hypothetical protein
MTFRSSDYPKSSDDFEAVRLQRALERARQLRESFVKGKPPLLTSTDQVMVEAQLQLAATKKRVREKVLLEAKRNAHNAGILAEHKAKKTSGRCYPLGD